MEKLLTNLFEKNSANIDLCHTTDGFAFGFTRVYDHRINFIHISTKNIPNNNNNDDVFLIIFLFSNRNEPQPKRMECAHTAMDVM